MRRRLVVTIVVALVGVLGIVVASNLRRDGGYVRHIFRLHVLDPIPESVRDIRYFKDRRAMHGLMAFAFEATPEDIRALVARHKLSPVSTPPDVIGTINDRFSTRIDWWLPAEQLDKMEIYGILLDTKTRIGDWQTRYAFVSGQRVYFLTSGFYSEDDYVVPVDPK